jgi:predicted nucleic acid-binding protein
VILVDTSVWIDHFRGVQGRLAELLNRGTVLMHPFVLGELALGNFKRRQVLDLLRELPAANVASDNEVLDFIERNKLFGLGIGFVDAHLLAAVRLTPDASLMTRDSRLAAVAERLSGH